MKAVEIAPEYLRRLDRKYPKFLKHLEKYDPDVFPDGDAFCCLSGPDLQEGTGGFGKTMQDAVEDWEVRVDKNHT